MKWKHEHINTRTGWVDRWYCTMEYMDLVVRCLDVDEQSAQPVEWAVFVEGYSIGWGYANSLEEAKVTVKHAAKKILSDMLAELDRIED